ncbi:MAG: hypothetical protein AAGG02_09420 [Cyanobacteria bacterium P01_H01_bin.15]
MNIAQITQQALDSGTLNSGMVNILENLMWNSQLQNEDLSALYRLQALLEEGYITVLKSTQGEARPITHPKPVNS